MAEYVGVTEQDVLNATEALMPLHDEDRPQDTAIVALMIGYLAGSSGDA
jgi:hypothetical protein